MNALSKRPNSMVYRWKSIPPIARIDAQVAGEELERIRTWNNGRLEPKAVVAASRDPGAPLHAAFEWSDEKAAEAYRQDQASHIIRHIDVVIDDSRDEPETIRAFVSVKRDEDRSYTSIIHALSDDELRAQVVAQAWVDLEAWHKRYAGLAEFAKIVSLIKARDAA